MGATGHPPPGLPLLDLRLLRSRTFLWGAILGSIAALTMIGVLFVMPQFFQGVQGTTAIGSGLRLLPLLAGLVVGAIAAEKAASFGGWRATVAAGFALIGIGLVLGLRTTPTSGLLPTSIWMVIYGLGLGLTTAAASSAALSQLSEADSGAGSALVQLVQKMAAPLGSAILGSVVSSVYLANLQVEGLPPSIARAVRQSVFAGRLAAGRLHSDALLENVRDAFTSGLATSLLVSATIAVCGGILACVFLPSRRETRRLIEAAPSSGAAPTVDIPEDLRA